MIKRRVMFEKLLIVVFISFFFWSTKVRFILFLHCSFQSFVFYFFLSFRSDSCLNSYHTFFLQQQYFVQKSIIFRFVILYLSCSLFSSHNVLFENYSFMFLFERNLFGDNFIVFFFFVVSIFSFRFLSLFWCLKFFVVLCFFSVFEFYDFDRKHSNLMFFHVVVFSKKKFVNFFFCFPQTLLCFEVFLIFCLIRNFFSQCI